MDKESVVGVASDHGGYELKEEIYQYLLDQGYQVVNLGCFDESSVDYPDYALKLGESLKEGEIDRGILVCGTGIGISIAANKIPGIRAAQCHDIYTAQMAREHNDANVLALGGRITGKNTSLRIVDIFMSTKFGEGRHKKRVEKISEIEQKYKKS
ncbi:ribose 5-phosphate isomerase B [Natranaerofaba carboxydovora]|uniref:ribose 5-phosphate isomerase B n=1 Tax=Natranaerofaba carboxydovora TaxID=2742683 RepID=UPI001F139AE4|nr:ribose 5-phosphate isomerase B [Natranaerofaba carboxydovora]UMZ75118.1 Putative sugar phosphate isomerase YwlF [Natranaerofaba carboxydovora]